MAPLVGSGRCSWPQLLPILVRHRCDRWWQRPKFPLVRALGESRTPRKWPAPRPMMLWSAGNPWRGRRRRGAAASNSSNFSAASKETAVNPPRMDADGPTASPTRDEPSSAGQRPVRGCCGVLGTRGEVVGGAGNGGVSPHSSDPLIKKRVELVKRWLHTRGTIPWAQSCARVPAACRTMSIGRRRKKGAKPRGSTPGGPPRGRTPSPRATATKRLPPSPAKGVKPVTPAPPKAARLPAAEDGGHRRSGGTPAREATLASRSPVSNSRSKGGAKPRGHHLRRGRPPFPPLHH